MATRNVQPTVVHVGPRLRMRTAKDIQRSIFTGLGIYNVGTSFPNIWATADGAGTDGISHCASEFVRTSSGGSGKQCEQEKYTRRWQFGSGVGVLGWEHRDIR